MNFTRKNKEKKRLLRQERERLHVALQNVDAQLDDYSDNDEGTITDSNDSVSGAVPQNIPSVATTVTTRVIRTNRRIENERLNDGRWFYGIRALNWKRWFERSRKTAYSVDPQSHVAGPLHTQETRSLLQLDTEASSETLKSACNPPARPVQDSDPPGTSHQLALENVTIHGSNSGGVEEHPVTENAQPIRHRHLKRTHAQMSGKYARPFASSLESLSACDMKTIHAMADPHIRNELANYGQYCGSTNPPRRTWTTKSGKKRCRTKQGVLGGDSSNNFNHYCGSAFKDWDTCKQLGTELSNAGDNELLAAIKAYRGVSCGEGKLYAPFETLVNRAFQFGRQTFVDDSGSSPQHDPPGLLNLMAVPTHSRPIHGCADKRKPDFVAMHVPPGAEAPSPVDAKDANCMIELKFDHVVQGHPPKLHDKDSNKRARSTYGAAAASQTSRLNHLEQLLDYNCFALAAQGPIRHHMLGLLINHMRCQIMYTDRAGCMISVEQNFSDDFSVLFAVLIGVYRSEARRAGSQSAIAVLSGSGATPLQLSDFDTSDKVVQTGAMANISRPITPFQVPVQLTSAVAQHVSAFAHGVNTMERPMAISPEAALTMRQSNIPRKTVRIRPSISRLAKSKGMEKNQAIAVSLAESPIDGSAALPRQFAPRYIFGSGMARYRCVLDSNPRGAAGSTLQLSWQPKSRLPEATVLRLANEHNIPGVPTLIASGNLADMDQGFIRSRLQDKFAEFPSIRPVNRELRAVVWEEECIPLSSVDNMRNFLSASLCILQVIIQLNDIGIMHTNVSEANMMALQAANNQGILVGFEFSILDTPPPGGKKICLESSQTPEEDDRTTTERSHEMALVVPEQVSDDVITHHVASLPLSRCSDYPPVHQFQHELQSFIWSILFILAGFRCGRRIINSDLEKWYTGDWDSIENAKNRFLRREMKHPIFVGEFAQSLGAEPQPLVVCSQLLAKMLLNCGSKELDAVHMLSTLQDARDAYIVGS